MTIEERAKDYACRGCKGTCKNAISMCHQASYRKADYIRIATEQDRIARAEEREKALKWILENLADSTGWDSYDIEQAFLGAMKGE